MKDESKNNNLTLFSYFNKNKKNKMKTSKLKPSKDISSKIQFLMKKTKELLIKIQT